MLEGVKKDIDTEKKKKLFSMITARPQQVSNFKQLARLLREDGQIESAIAVLREGIAVHPDDRNMKSHLARTYLEAGEIDEALAEYRKLMKLYPEDYANYEKVERICREKGRIGDAVSMYRRIPKGNKLRERSYERLHYLLVEKLHDFRRGAKNMEDAIAEFGPTYRRCKNLGRLYGKLGEWVKAAEQYRTALGFKKDDADLASLLGWALVESGRLDEAEKYFKMIRNSFQGMNSLAELYLKRGRLDAAEKELEGVGRLYPGNSRVQINRAELRLKRGEPARARDLAEDALRRTPSYFAFEQAHGHAVLGAAFDRLGEKEKASYHAELARALRKGPDTYTALIGLAEAKIASGELDGAEAVLNRVLELYAGNARALIDQCEIQLLRKDPRQAVHFGEAGLRSADPRYREERLKGHLLLERAYDLLSDEENSKRHRRLATELERD